MTRPLVQRVRDGAPADPRLVGAPVSAALATELGGSRIGGATRSGTRSERHAAFQAELPPGIIGSAAVRAGHSDLLRHPASGYPTPRCVSSEPALGGILRHGSSRARRIDGGDADDDADRGWHAGERRARTPVVRLRHLVSRADGLRSSLKLRRHNRPAPTRTAWSGDDRGRRAVADCAPVRPSSSTPAAAHGSSLALVCAVRGCPLRIVSSDAFADEKIRTMRAFGADVELISSPEGIDPDAHPPHDRS